MTGSLAAYMDFLKNLDRRSSSCGYYFERPSSLSHGLALPD